MDTEGKCLIVSAPSGAGKTTIVHHLLKTHPKLEFSISATTRVKRPNETDGKDYHFLSVKAFKKNIEANAFVEWEEVYPGQFYGTYRTEIGRIWDAGKTVVFDVDVRGAIRLKKIFEEQAFAIFIMPPSIDELKKRLIARGNPPNLDERIAKAREEIRQAPFFDAIVINEDVNHAKGDATQLVNQFLKS